MDIDMLNRASWVMFAFCNYVCIVCGFFGFKISQNDESPHEFYLGLPSVLALVDAKNSRSRVLRCIASVLHVCRSSSIAQITKSVVGFVAVDVVDHVIRPLARHVQPRQTVGVVTPAIYLDTQIPCGMARRSTYLRLTAQIENSGKKPGIRVIVKKFAQSFCGKIGFSHDTVPSLIGQRPARVISAGGLRYFNMAVA